jgi:hypothetical protein
MLIKKSQVYAFTSTSSASDFNIIQSQLEQEQSLSQTAATSCCAINHNLDDTESQALSDAIDDIRFNYQNIGNMFAIIKVYLDKINNADYQLKNDFISLSDTTNQIVGCLSKLNPGTIITGDLQSIPTSLQGINDLFANATAS